MKVVTLVTLVMLVMKAVEKKAGNIEVKPVTL